MRIHITDSIQLGVIAGQPGWWLPKKDPPDYGSRESNMNLLANGLAAGPAHRLCVLAGLRKQRIRLKCRLYVAT